MHLEYNEMNPTLLMTKGGKLYYNSVKNRQVFDVTSSPYMYLMENCGFEDGLTLTDVLKFVDMHVDFLEEILGSDTRAIVAESQLPTEETSELEYLELYWFIDASNSETTGLRFPSLHGIGLNQEKYSVAMSQINNIANIPIKLSEKTELFRNDNVEILPNAQYGLLGILYGIIWELSFFGGPESRDRFIEEMKETLRNIKEHPESLMSMDDFLKKSREGLDIGESDEV